VFVDMYPVNTAHAPYSRLWPVLLYHIFPHYLINGIIYGGGGRGGDYLTKTGGFFFFFKPFAPNFSSPKKKKGGIFL